MHRISQLTTWVQKWAYGGEGDIAIARRDCSVQGLFMPGAVYPPYLPTWCINTIPECFHTVCFTPAWDLQCVTE